MRAMSRRSVSSSNNRDVLERIAMALLEREVLDANEMQMIIEGKDLPARINPNAPADRRTKCSRC